MSINSFADFTEMHTSFLQEIGNMGAGNAATALSDMVTAPTDISVPTVKIVSSAEGCKLVDMLSGRTAAYLITLCGDLKGSLLFVIPFAFVERLVQTYFPGISIKSKADMDEMATSVVREMVNIVAASYANNFAMISGFMVDISVPEATTAPSMGIMAQQLIGTQALCFINNTLEIVDCKKNFNVLFFPELETIKKFMGKIGIACD